MSADESEVETLEARHRRVLPHWVDQMYEQPLELVRGKGTHVWDADGNEYLDFFGGIVTVALGHGLPEVQAALRDQLDAIIHSSTLYLIRPMVELAELLVELSPAGIDCAFFVGSGTEAVEAALLVATNYRRSNQVISFRQSYHGRSFGAVGVTGQRGYSPTSFSPLNVQYAPYANCLRCPFHLSYPSCEVACAHDLRTVIESQTSGDVAAVIVEPIQGVNGFVTPPPEFLPIIREICDEYGILLIADEVQTGFGRTGESMWGIEADGVVPDLMVLAKGLGNGLPIAAVLGRSDVMNSLGAGSISTFGGNHLVTAGALAAVRYGRDHDLTANARRQGARLRAGLDAIGARHPHAIAEVRGKGLMQALDFADDDERHSPRPDLASAVQERCREGGLLVGKGGVAWNVLRLSPALVIDESEIDRALAILSDACAQALEPQEPGA
ncbi:MAG: 4-aminobutyrate aminotransferase [Actinomycetota bacterium]|nr:4-aminobutyrate aminotransferase [Actinomycetota bacterium]